MEQLADCNRNFISCIPFRQDTKCPSTVLDTVDLHFSGAYPVKGAELEKELEYQEWLR